MINISNKEKSEFLNALDQMTTVLPILKIADKPFYDQVISKLMVVMREHTHIAAVVGRQNGKTISSWYFDEINRKPFIKQVIFNAPATVVIWSDGTKTVVKCQPGDEYSKETGLAMCIAKKYLGNKGNFNEVFKKFIEGYDPSEV